MLGVFLQIMLYYDKVVRLWLIDHELEHCSVVVTEASVDMLLPSSRLVSTYTAVTPRLM